MSKEINQIQESGLFQMFPEYVDNDVLLQVRFSGSLLLNWTSLEDESISFALVFLDTS